MKTETSKYKSRKSMLVEIYSEYHRRHKHHVYEDDFFFYDLSEDDLVERLGNLGNKIKLIASIPSILFVIFLAYLGIRM